MNNENNSNPAIKVLVPIFTIMGLALSSTGFWFFKNNPNAQYTLVSIGLTICLIAVIMAVINRKK